MPGDQRVFLQNLGITGARVFFLKKFFQKLTEA